MLGYVLVMPTAFWSDSHRLVPSISMLGYVLAALCGMPCGT